MNAGDLHRAALTAIAARHPGEPPRDVHLTVRPLGGGLSAPVTLAWARYLDAAGRRRRIAFVVKALEGGAEREIEVYRWLGGSAARELSPGVLGARRAGGRSHLLLERIRRAHTWPWQEMAHARRVLQRLALLHTTSAPDDVAGLLPAWDYEAELRGAAAATLELAESLGPRLRREHPALARALPALARVVAALDGIRRELRGFKPLPPTVIHGDVHPGNVLVVGRPVGHETVLIDWGRARVGSPLEDVSSWLQSLSTWEPEARRRHDTLLTGYLAERGLPGPTTALRDAYWLAGASNALAGALHVQLSAALAPDAQDGGRGAALHAAADWLRVIRRADERLR